MDKSIIRDFAKLRVLTPCDYQRMDELVQDLSRALEETARHGGGRGAAGSGVGASSATSASAAAGGGGGGSHHRKRQGMARGRKRRAPKLSLLLAQCSLTPPDPPATLQHSDSASSDFVGGVQKQSDSDEISSSGHLGAQLPVGQRLAAGLLPVANFAESDSVNENFSPARPHRRKRKFKRMAVDPMLAECSLSGGSSMFPCSLPGKPHRRKDRGGGCVETNSYRLGEPDPGACGMSVFPGKRKHSMRERSVELHEVDAIVEDTIVEGGSAHSGIPGASRHHRLPPGSGGSSGALRYGLLRGGREGSAENGMELGEEALYLTGIESSSSLSSSESDAGIYTNDEGREGDDEHSDFYHEVEQHGVSSCPGGEETEGTPWWDTHRNNDNVDGYPTTTIHSILAGSLRHMSYEAQRAFCARVCQLTTVPGREIRAGRRRLRDRRPGFSIVSSMNEKISKFLQDPDQNELRLHHMRKTEMDQLSHLASLYSLSMSDNEHNECPVLTKTRNTMQAISVDKVGVANLWNMTAVSDIKRRRRTPPTSPEVQGNLVDQTEPIPESTGGAEILRDMGWEPTSSLTLDPQGSVRAPLLTCVKSKSQDFGFSSSNLNKLS